MFDQHTLETPMEMRNDEALLQVARAINRAIYDRNMDRALTLLGGYMRTQALTIRSDTLETLPVSQRHEDET